MAVLKYRASDGTVKTLGLNQSVGIAGVTSVNGKTGAVTGLYDAENPPPYPVASVNGKTGNVTGLYSLENPPPYPVTSVNGQTGAVTIPTPKINGTITSGSLIGTGLQMWKISLVGIGYDVISTDKNYTINGDYTKIYPIAMVKAQFGRGFAGTLSINPYTPALNASFYKDTEDFDFNGDYYIWLYNEDATATWG